MKYNTIVISAAPLILALSSGGALAQTSSGGPSTTGSTASAAFTGPAPLAPSVAVSEVVVTAERRESTVQRTAATINVVGADGLRRQQIVEFKDLNAVLPDTTIVPATNFLQISIRGLGSEFIDPRADPDVAVSVNGLFYDRPLPNGFGFLDVSRVEDLNGPQGTLYGRNAAAGAVNIITNQPTDKFGGMLQGSVGSLNENDVTAVLNLPATDTLAFRAAFARDRRDGYIGDYYGDTHFDVGRLMAKWTPTSKLTVLLESDYLQDGGHGNAGTTGPCGGVSPYSLDIPVQCSQFGFSIPEPKIGRTQTFVASDQVHIDYDAGFATLTSITGFVGSHIRYTDLPNGNIFNGADRSDNYDYSEELRIAGHDSANHKGGFAWQSGAYFFTGSGDYSYHAVGPTTVFSKVPQTSQAGFVQATYGVTDRFRLTGGVRYTRDFKGVEAPGKSQLEVSGSNWSFKANAEYDLQPGELIYATVSTGYVAGGPNGGAPGSPPVADLAPLSFKPETITAYEVGAKNRLLGGRLLLNASFYYYNIDDFQITDVALLNNNGSPGALGLIIENVGKLQTYGGELNAAFNLTPDDRFTGTLTVSQGSFGKLQLVTVNPGLGFEPTFQTFDSGLPLIDVAPVGALLGYVHTWRLESDRSLEFSVNTKISDAYHLVLGSTDPLDTQAGYTMTDASLSFDWANHKYAVRGWVKNIEDNAVRVYGQNIDTYIYSVLPPRTYGVTLTVNF